MKSVLVTNDDGVGADGIRALAELAARHFDRVIVVAPKNEASQIGHRVTTYSGLTFEEREPGWIAVDGTPADCVRVGLHILDEKPDWVWSGINHGGNLGRHDYYISGTLAAAREAAFFGIKALGASHYMKRGLQLDWSTAAARTGRAFEAIQGQEEASISGFWAVNLPHLPPENAEPEIIFCEQEKAPLDVVFEAADDNPQKLNYVGTYHDRPRSAGSDVDVCFGGNIAVSHLTI